jgi:hypothetical protein
MLLGIAPEVTGDSVVIHLFAKRGISQPDLLRKTFLPARLQALCLEYGFECFSAARNRCFRLACHREKEEKRRQAAERAEQDVKAAQKRKAEEKPVPVFETSDPEVAARLREAYRPELIDGTKSGGKYFLEDREKLR